MDESRAPIPMAWEVRLHGVYGTMGAAEKRVADYFKAEGFDILSRSIAEISEASGTSEATIVRFCRHVGYSGLKEFKIALAKEQAASIPEGELQLTWEDDMRTVRDKVFTDAIRALRDSMALVDEGALTRAVEALQHATHIDIYGLGGSVPVASYLRHQLMKVGLRSNLYTDAQSQRLSMAQFSREDVTIAISASGETQAVVSAVKWARQQGATTIALTNRPDSPLAQLCHILLVTTGGPFLFGGQNTLSRFAQLAVVNTLYLGVALAMGEEALESLQAKKAAAQHATRGLSAGGAGRDHSISIN